MAEERMKIEEPEMASTGKSIVFAIGFWAVYVLIVFAVLEIFFKLPF
jgi:hypothetical protein